MIIKLKTLYYKISLREKTLLGFFLWIMVFLWIFMFAERVSRLVNDIRVVNSSLVYQKIWLDSEESILERLVESRRILNPEKTYSKNQFIARVDGIARSSEGTYDVTNPTTALGEVFNEHSLSIQFKDVPIETLITFDQAIHKENPYLGMDQVKIIPNRRDPILLSAQFDIIALELKNIQSAKQ